MKKKLSDLENVFCGRTLQIIAVSFFFFYVSISQVLAVNNNYAQNKKLTISMENATIASILETIESQSEFRFFYNNRLVDVNKKVSVEAKRKSIWNILDKLFPEGGILYRVEGKQVTLLSNNQDSRENIVQQSHKVTGKVTDETNETLPGVNVVEKGTTHGTTTDINGDFSITVKGSGAVLVFSFVGYQTKEIQVGNRNTISLQLEKNIQNLQQVVVMGYGTQKIKDVTGAISTVTSKEIKDRPVLQLANALEGKMAGVEVISPSGKPQAGAFIRIRGTTSINGSSNPLYVVDGVPTQDILTLNPNDIKSITVLKDASSEAIYGASGANGVVIITTKRGKNKKASVNFSSYYGFSKVIKHIAVLNSSQYINLMNELGLKTDWSIYTANTDWQNEIYRTAILQNYQLSVSGSDAKTNYYISGNWNKQDGIVRKNYAQRYAWKMNFDRKMNSWFKVGTSISFGKWHDVDISDNVGAGRGGVILGALETPELIGIFNPDGTYTGNPLQLSWENPVAGTDAPDQNYYQSNFYGNVYLQATFLKNFKYKTLASYHYSGSQYKYFLDPFSTDWGRANKGIGEESTSKNEYWYIENTLTYKKKFGKQSLDALVGFIVTKRKAQSLDANVSHFANDVIKTINGGSRIESVNSTFGEKSNVSQIARINYGYANKYLLTANFRADASSVFGPSKRWGFFPSFSAGWRISQEAFLKNSKIINDLKIRFGWGQVGNDGIDDYAWYGTVGSGYNYVIGSVIVPGTAPETLTNADLKWESTSQTNLGIDLLILDSRIGVTADAYLKNTSNLLLSMPIPTSTGFNSSMQNIGNIQNKGIEFLIKTKNLVNKLKWNTDFNISLNRNKVISLGGQIIHAGDIYQRGNVTITEKGKPIGSFYGYIALGVDPNTGLMIYKDINGDGVINDKDKTIIGDPSPKFVYGLTNTLSFKGFTLSIFIQGVYGNKIFNASRVETEGMNNFENQLATTLKRWEKQGDITNVPKAMLGSKYNSLLSTRFLEDGSYVRIKTLSLSYAIPKNILRSVRLSSARVYVTAENLYTFTKYTGYDPEVNAFGNSNLAQGIDYGTYPQPRNIIFGIDLSF